MPHINRIRVNNVKYNNGTQFYDDFVMKFFGRNAIYDLVNGGGKSFLLLLLLQNMLPNCKLDEKQPLSKVFQDGNGNTTIHSMIEWELDKEASERFQSKYLLTAFCAKKGNAKPVEYFNYTIHYNEYNDYDIVNFPLVEGMERVNYSSLRKKLNTLKDTPLLNCKVMLYDTTEKYMEMLSNFGIYESHWQIIRGINETEGHVRTFIEQHYKTTKKVVENLLIEEIIDKANRVKSGKNDTTEELVDSLIGIESKILELSRKQKEIDNYDSQIIALNELISRIHILNGTLRENEEATENFRLLYQNVTSNIALLEELCEKKRCELEEYEEQKKVETQYVELLEIEVDELERTNLSKKHAASLDSLRKVETILDELEKDLKKKEANNHFINYQKDTSYLIEIESVLENIRKKNSDKLEHIHYLTYHKKNRDDSFLTDLSIQKKSHEKDLESCSAKVMENENEGGICKENIGSFRNEVKNQSENIMNRKEKIKELNSKILHLSNELPEQFRFSMDEEQVILYEKERDLVSEKTLQNNARMVELKNIINDSEKLISSKEEAVKIKSIHLEEYKKKLELFADKELKINEIKQICKQDESVQIEFLKKHLIALNTSSQRELVEKQRNMKLLKEKLEALKDGIPFNNTDETRFIFEQIKKRYHDAELGTSYIANRDQTEKTELLTRIPMLPYAIIVDQQTFQKLSKNQELEWIDTASIIPIVSKSSIMDTTFIWNKESIIYAQNDIENFIDQTKINSQIIKCENTIVELDQTIQLLKENISMYSEFCDIVSDFTNHYLCSIAEWRANFTQLTKELEHSKVVIEDCANKINTSHMELDQLLEQNTKLSKDNLNYDSMIGLLKNRITINESLVQKEEAHKEKKLALKECLEKEVNLKEERKQLERQQVELQSHMNEIDKQMDFIKEGWEKTYQAYYVLGNYNTYDDTSQKLEAELNGAIEAYLNQNTNVIDKEKLRDTYKESIRRSKQEILNRNFSIDYFLEEDKANILFEYKNEVLQGIISELEKHKALKKECNQAVQENKSFYDKACALIEDRKKSYSKNYTTTIYLKENDKLDLKKSIHLHDNKKRALIEQCELFTLSLKKIKDQSQLTEKLQIDISSYGEAHEIYFHKQAKRSQQLYEYSTLEQNKKQNMEKLKFLRKSIEIELEKCQKSKGNCVEKLDNLGQHNYADNIQTEINIRNNLEGMCNVEANLSKSKEYFICERNRIEESLKEIFEIKERFKSKCLQKSLDIRTDIEKFAKLSKMVMNGKEMQTVKLFIGYLPDELQKSAMDKHIEDMIYKVADFKDEKEKKKLLREQLSSRHLYSIIVKDTGSMKLELYKRERVKEDSRFLRYEEAVGSTGQSQGIYILFLIAIINYISRMYSTDDNDKNLKKAIFIDNPFGAAKDTYIWDPIMAMLRENSVQMIVPTRGVPAGISNRIDMNYTLGQNMKNGKLQTVVVNYSSMIDTNEAEYIKSEAKQMELFDESSI